jgi:hypothetical protein
MLKQQVEITERNVSTLRSLSKGGTLLDTQSTVGSKMERSETMIKLTLSEYNNSAASSRTSLTILDLTGDVLDIITEYLLPANDQQMPPVFVRANSNLLVKYSKYKKENYGIQNEILVDQIAELKKELFDYFDQKLFKMSKGLSIIYYSNINSKEWQILEELCKER